MDSSCENEFEDLNTINENEPLMNSHEESDNTQHEPPTDASWRQKLQFRFKEIWNSRQNNVDPSKIDLNKLLSIQETIKFATRGVGKFTISLTACFILTFFILKCLPLFQDDQHIFFYLTPLEEKAGSTASSKLGTAVANCLIFVSVVIVQTIIIVLLYKYKFYRVIKTILIMGYLSLLFSLSFTILSQVLSFLNVPMDYLTFCLIVWNISGLGIAAVFSSFSLKIQQVFHIVSSSFVSAFFTRVLPNWTGWTVLSILVVWDLVAVLAPFGPLKMLVELAQERKEDIFSSLIFKTMIEPGDSSNAPFSTQSYSLAPDHDSDSLHSNDTDKPSPQPLPENHTETAEPGEAPQIPPESSNHEDEEDEKPSHQLGLGDFIFYSLLLGKTLLYLDWTVTILCYISIIFGLMLTFGILIVYGRALPALPISLCLGITVYFSTTYMVSPYFSLLKQHNILI